MSAAVLIATSILCASLDRLALSKALTRLKHLVARRSALPVLEAVLIQSRGDHLALTVTDLNIFVRIAVAATVNTPGTLLVSLRKLAEVTRNGARRAEILGTSLSLGGVTHRLAALPSANYPAVPEPAGEVLVTVMRSTLARLLSQTAYAISEDDTRPHLAAVLIERCGGELRFVATDGHRLALARVPDDGPEFKVLVARALIEELARMVDAPGGVVRLHRDRDRAWFVSGDEWVSGKIVDATFPQYQQVIPEGYDSSITMPTGDLHEALRALAPRGTPTLRIVPELDAARVRLTVDDGDGNVTDGQVLASFSGGLPKAIGFNGRYLRELVNALTDDDTTVKIYVWGELDPVRIDSAHGTTAVVMPLRV